MNKDLYHRKVKLPESLKNHLQKSFEMVEGVIVIPKVTTVIRNYVKLELWVILF